ncbi:putative acyltransferase [Mycobacterium tuberculosis]|nr:putative acyltransferase [Mycobacterium tuberculosis]
MTSVPPADRPRLRELDLLRFIAAMAVMLHHFVQRIGGLGMAYHHSMPGLSEVSHFGYLGVDLFFLISGFVILMSAWGRSVGDFAVSRVARIFPAYWFAVTLALVVFLATGYSPPGSDDPLTPYLPNMTMLQPSLGMPHMEIVYWTLWIELHFYVLIAVIVWRGITYRSCVAFMVVWLLCALFATGAQSRPFMVLLIPQWAPYFIAGMAFFLIHRFGSNLVLWLITAACWGLCVYNRTSTAVGVLFWPGVGNAVLTGAVTLMFLIMAMVATHQFEMVRWRGLTVLGALTYPLYLVHETIGRALADQIGSHLGRWQLLGASCAAALASAYLVHRFVEDPVQRRLRSKLKQALARLPHGLPEPSRTNPPSRSSAEASR